MPNMDYPGPCPNCLGIDGCSSEANKKKSIANYCKGLEMELNAWKARLYDVMVEAEHLDVSNREKLTDTMNLIKSTMAELERVKDRMVAECPVSMSQEEKNIGGKLEQLRVHYTKALNVVSPGWFGG